MDYLLKVFILLLLASSHASGQSDGTKPPRTIIVGAGISGLAAAAHLQEKGFTDYVILEASNRIGGRLETMYINKEEGHRLEMGAGWIHGTDNNVLYDLAKKHNLLQKKDWMKNLENNNPRFSEYKSEFRNADGSLVPYNIYHPIVELFTKSNEEADSFYRKGLPEGYTNIFSVESYIVNQFTKKYGTSGDATWNTQRNVLETLMRRETWDVGTHSMDHVSLKYYGSFKTIEGEDVPLPNGFSSLVEVVSKPIPGDKILLYQVVEKINYANDSKVKITVRGGQVYEGDYVIVTPSLGYLKNKSASMFDPPLSAKKMSAINKWGFGTADRIYLEFPNLNFIKNGEVGRVLFVRPPFTNENPTDWEKKVFVCYVEPVPKANMLTCWLSGLQAIEMEKKTNDEVISGMKSLLEQFFGTTVPTPVKMIRSRWYSNEFVRGVYSFPQVGSSQEDLEALAKPIFVKRKNRSVPAVLFAGEATHPDYYSSAHGAYLTGIREAKRITGGAMKTFINTVVICACLAMTWLF